MLTVIAVAGVALIAGALLGWLLRGPRVQRAEVARAVAETRLEEIERAHGNVANTFAAEAQRAFQNVGESLLQRSKTQIDGSLDTKRAEIETLLTPVREMLDQYRHEVAKSELVRNEAYGGLQQQLLTLFSTVQAGQKEAARLANALHSPAVRGSWGENSLKRCVELAGMSEFCDFNLQETLFSEEGRRLRPDLIVRLPNKRVIAVDAKVPLTEYQSAANEENEARRNEMLQAHAKTLRRHIETLSRREYQASMSESLDFTVMFLPGEHFLSAALMADPSLFEFAASRRVFIASPMVLLPLLRAVESGWKAERTEENAKRMYDAGVDLFNRFVKVMELFSTLGGSLRRTVEHYNAVIGSVDSRLWPKGEEMQRLAGSGKELASLEQIEAVPLESSKLRLTMQGEGPADVVQFEK
ncbi:MAG TPA: DNA recombination protein RmuC [Thermoanaerobaculia bacterium]